MTELIKNQQLNASKDVDSIYRTVFKLGDDFALGDEMGFDDVPGWDSLGHMLLVSELESRLGLKLDMDEIIRLNSVGRVRELVSRINGGSQ